MTSGAVRKLRINDKKVKTSEEVYTSTRGVTIIGEVMGGWRGIVADGPGFGRFWIYDKDQLSRALPEDVLKRYMNWDDSKPFIRHLSCDDEEIIEGWKWDIRDIDGWERMLDDDGKPSPCLRAVILALIPAELDRVVFENYVEVWTRLWILDRKGIWTSPYLFGGGDNVAALDLIQDLIGLRTTSPRVISRAAWFIHQGLRPLEQEASTTLQKAKRKERIHKS